MREHSLLRPVGIALILALLGACNQEPKTDSPGQNAGASPERTRMVGEFNALKQRATALNAEAHSGDPARAERARDEGSKLVSDFRRWAGEFKQESRDKRVPNDGNCAWLTEDGHEQCVRTHVTIDYCDYFCVDIPQTEPAQPTEPL